METCFPLQKKASARKITEVWIWLGLKLSDHHRVSPETVGNLLCNSLSGGSKTSLEIKSQCTVTPENGGITLGPH